ncbi:MAG: asparagine synthetase B family protein [Sphingomicrobium sp.]
MTALAGCVGLPETELEHAVGTMLQAQHRCGGARPRISALAGASFGVALRQQLPEDSFDRQPLVESGRFMLVADIRLDNREELLDALRIGRDEVADSDIALRAWMRWQESCFERLVGDYAIAVWDSAEQRLILARDATGQRPLLYWHDRRRIAFSSMPIGLLKSPVVQTGFHFDALASETLAIPNFSDSTFFDKISRVKPGHFATFERGTVTQTRHWNPEVGSLNLSDGEFVEAYHEQMERALRPALRRSSGAIGVHLSSGFDSSAVAATAARLSPKAKPIAFTSAPRLGFDGPVQRGRIADESELAALTADMYGLQHVVIRPAGRVLQLLRDHTRLYQEPNKNIPNMHWWTAIHLSAREKGVSTLLTGELGNLSIHAGELAILADWVHRGELIEWWRQSRAVVKTGRVRWRGVLINSFESWLGPQMVRLLERRFMGAPTQREQSYLHDHWLKELRRPSLETARELLKGSFNQRRLMAIRTEDIAIHRKGALAESGIDERDPLANRRLIEFSLKLPPEQLLQRGNWRPFATRALAGRLPDAVLNAKVRGYQGADWFEQISRDEVGAIVEEMSTSSTVAQLFDLSRIRADVDRWPASGAADFNSQMIFRGGLTWALAVGVFLKEFEPLVSASASRPL